MDVSNNPRLDEVSFFPECLMLKNARIPRIASRVAQKENTQTYRRGSLSRGKKKLQNGRTGFLVGNIEGKRSFNRRRNLDIKEL